MPATLARTPTRKRWLYKAKNRLSAVRTKIILRKTRAFIFGISSKFVHLCPISEIGEFFSDVFFLAFSLDFHRIRRFVVGRGALHYKEAPETLAFLKACISTCACLSLNRVFAHLWVAPSQYWRCQSSCDLPSHQAGIGHPDHSTNATHKHDASRRGCLPREIGRCPPPCESAIA